MKAASSSLAFLVLIAFALICRGQAVNVPAPTPWSIVHREINERTWQRTKFIPSPAGQTVPEIESYKEVGNCICFQGQNGFQDSQCSVSVLPDGSGASTNAPCKIYIPPDIYNGVIRIVTANGLELESEPIGVWLTDNANTIQVSTLTNSIGELVSSNQVLFPGAFVGGLKADLLLTVRASGLEQDAIIRAQSAATASPQQLGLNSAETRLQLITEFVNSPPPAQSVGPVNSQDGLQNTTLSFGSLKMIEGQALQLGSGNAPPLQNRIRIYNAWATTTDGRSLLIEQVPYQRVSAQLAALPRSASRTTRSGGSLLHRASSSRVLPRRSFKASASSLQLRPMDFKAKPGLDLDYVTLDSAETNMTFASDSPIL